MLHMQFGNVHLILTGAFEGEDVTHIEGDVNPMRDMEIISEELRKKVRVISKQNRIFYSKRTLKSSWHSGFDCLNTCC